MVEQKGGLDFRMVENTGGGKAANSADVNSKCMDEEGNLLNALSDVCSYLLNEKINARFPSLKYVRFSLTNKYE